MIVRRSRRRRLLPLVAFLFVPVIASAQTTPAPLKPNQKATAAYLQRVCAELRGANGLTPAQQDLVNHCAFFEGGNATAAALLNGYFAVGGQQINALGPQTKKFGTLQQDNLAARLAELRRGVRGASVSGLTVVTDDGTVLADRGGDARDYLPEGASGDRDGAWLDGRLGVFANGSIKEGSKKTSGNGFAFDLSDDAVTLGADYRIDQHFVVGIAVGGGQTTTDFANSMGRLELRAKGVSVYASYYGATYYVDAVGGYGVPHLDTTRHIAYAEAGGTGVDEEAYGRSRIHDLWTGISAGRPFDWRQFSLTPEGSINFHEIRLSEFSESVSAPGGIGSGLGLTFGNTVVPSLQGRAGLRGGYTFSGPWGVFEPNLHATWVREFRNHPDEFSARFTNAPDAAGEPIQTDPPEGHYMAYGGGMNIQLAHSISGFVDYEELRTLKVIKSHEFSMGVRWQYGL